MRLPSLLIVLLFCLVSLGAAQSASLQPPTYSELAMASSLPMSDSSPATLDDPFSGLRQFGRFFGAEVVDEDGPTCYTMRTYTVRRVNPDSDETRLFRYSTCPKAWKFGLRHADGNVQDAGPDPSSR
jgi:hypothetical protein